MYRSLFPFILASIGFTAIILAGSMPLFEWQISDLEADLPSSYEIVVSPSPWNALIGESLNDDLYLAGEVTVLMDGRECIKEDLTFAVTRSKRDEFLDQKWLNSYKNVSWLTGWSWIEIILSSVYIVLFVLWSKQGRVLHAIFLAGTAVILFLNLTQILRLVAPFPYSHYFGTVNCNHGSITFTAMLSKFHYETLTVLLVGILLEICVPLIMLRQISQVAIDRKKLLSHK